jgi:hypothetical protein
VELALLVQHHEEAVSRDQKKRHSVYSSGQACSHEKVKEEEEKEMLWCW